MLMQLKPNNPLLIIGVIVIIGIIIVLLQVFVAKPIGPIEKKSIVSEENNMKLLEKKSKYKEAPELAQISGYINAKQGFKLADVKGKVILLDFWTYSCINCIRTLPFLTAWNQKYKDKGLVIVGVHSPEFEFEKNLDNVKKAVQKYNINYPVVLDNDYGTWKAYDNHYWPHHFLIDADGFIRFDHIGEGGYEETEQQIQQLLKERDESIALNNSTTQQTNNPSFNEIATPEIYLGYAFARAPLANDEGFQPEKDVNYFLPKTIPANLVALEGVWKNNSDNMELLSDSGKIVLTFKAKQANIVAGGKAQLTAIVGNNSKTIQTNDQTLYTVVQSNDYLQKSVEIEVKGKGFKLYTFTFG